MGAQPRDRLITLITDSVAWPCPFPGPWGTAGMDPGPAKSWLPVQGSGDALGLLSGCFTVEGQPLLPAVPPGPPWAQFEENKDSSRPCRVLGFSTPCPAGSGGAQPPHSSGSPQGWGSQDALIPVMFPVFSLQLPGFQPGTGAMRGGLS